MYSYPMLIPLPAREVERMAAALEPWAFERIYGAWWGRVIPANAKDVVRAFCASLRRSDRLTSRQSRSAFARRNASESSGSAGSPPRSSHTANAIVAPNDAVISTQVSAVRNRKRSVAAEEEREEQHVRNPEVRGAALAGNGEREREVLEHARVVMDDRVRRAAPDGVRVDPGDDQRDDDDPRRLLEEVEEQPAGERRGAELRERRRALPADHGEDDGEDDAHERSRASASATWCSGSRIQTGAKHAGMTSSAMNATSHHTEKFGRLSWPAK